MVWPWWCRAQVRLSWGCRAHGCVRAGGGNAPCSGWLLPPVLAQDADRRQTEHLMTHYCFFSFFSFLMSIVQVRLRIRCSCRMKTRNCKSLFLINQWHLLFEMPCRYMCEHGKRKDSQLDNVSSDNAVTAICSKSHQYLNKASEIIIKVKWMITRSDSIKNSLQHELRVQIYIKMFFYSEQTLMFHKIKGSIVKDEATKHLQGESYQNL